jgi:hypothetical protein
LNEEEIKANAMKSYKEKVNIRKIQEEPMEIKEKKQVTENKRNKGRINTDDEEEIKDFPDEHPTLIDIIKKDDDRGFRKGNKPKGMKTRYQEKKGDEEITRDELKGNAASIFLSHNMNKDKWWNDPQAKKEVWKTKNLTRYILSNASST